MSGSGVTDGRRATEVAASSLVPRDRHADVDVAAARKQFFELAREPQGLPDRILRSWRRCLARGMEVDVDNHWDALTHGEFADVRERFEVLLSIAEPELEFLNASLGYTGSLISINAPDGTVLDTRGGGVIDALMRKALVPGARWDECTRGTNGIGTSLEENHLVEVWGPEHYHASHSVFCCTAAPILDHTGRIAGVINVTGDGRHPRGYARTVVKRAIRDIEYRLIGELGRRLTALRFHPRAAYLNSAEEGVLLLDGDVVVGANRHALQWLGASWEIIGCRWDDCFEAPLPTTLVGQIMPRRRLEFACEVTNPGSRARKRVGDPRTNAYRRAPGLWLNTGLQSQLERARRVLNAGLCTMVLGETGTGKEQFARALHAQSLRANGPFVAVNCGALPDSLIESELFGYVDGAFTGAKRGGTQGRIAESHGGVLFLDEIGDMPLSLQTRLLRVLQERLVSPIGGGAPRAVDFAVICATNRPIESMVESGLFRSDLFYRLQHLIIRLPSWRDLPVGDKRSALEHFCKEAGLWARGMSLSPELMEAILHLGWPGNFRQLATALQAMVVLEEPDCVLGLESLPRDLSAHVGGDDDRGGPEQLALRNLTKAAIEASLHRNGGRMVAVAHELGIHRSTLYRHIARFGIKA